ncbi:MAG: transglutaminase-like domain-containing protein [Nitrososphaerota archaeon]|nr:transglutaminase-like domain-containing protein [Candidatus Bathyarchaeota archaeon]MDW8048263.1 transglutaminase-like domain-containing protein [Nitrososphaerota archaeon]
MNNSRQTVYLTNLSHPLLRIDEDMDGNPVALMDLTNVLQPNENITYEVAYTVVLKPYPKPNISENLSGSLNEISESYRSLYCVPNGPWLLNHTDLIGLAFELAGEEKNVLKILSSFIRWINENIRYGSDEVPRYPNETLIEKVGDCDDQANLLISLCRIVGIPAYLQIGCIYLPGRQPLVLRYWGGSLILNLTRIGWHGWAMVYVPPWGWLPVDLTYVIGDGIYKDPLNAIRNSALFTQPTVQYANVTKYNYVGETRYMRDYLTTWNFQIIESDEMVEESVMQTTGFPSMEVRILSALVICLATFIAKEPKLSFSRSPS